MFPRSMTAAVMGIAMTGSVMATDASDGTAAEPYPPAAFRLATTDHRETDLPPALEPRRVAISNPASEGPLLTELAARTRTDEKFITEQTVRQWSASGLIGLVALNRKDEVVGRVIDILVDSEGRMAGIVLSVGGFIGIGSKPVAVNWETAVMLADESQVIVNVSRAELEAAPEFEAAVSRRDGTTGIPGTQR